MSERRPDVEIGAWAKAKRLRFKSKPETDVEFHGADEHEEGSESVETESGSVRENLPDEVEPGKTYRDVKIGWRAAARIKDPQRER